MRKYCLLIVSALLLCAAMQVSAQKEVAFDSPKLKLFLPEAGATGRAVLILPGGGYAGLASDNEGYGWVDYFTGKGIAAAVLEYTLPEGNRSLPFDDVEKAMKLLCSHAEEWHIDTAQIGIMGSSAGGHLASTYATHCKPELAPAFQILFYPVITMDVSYTHRGSRDHLLGTDVSPELEKEYCECVRQYKQKVIRDKGERKKGRDFLYKKFNTEAKAVCPNDDERLNIILDIAYMYGGNKQFCWDTVGELICGRLEKSEGGESNVCIE